MKLDTLNSIDRRKAFYKMKTYLNRVLSIVVVAAMCLSLSISVCASPSELNEDLKSQYYAEYLKIAAEVSKEADQDISVIPIDQFKDEDWLSPEEFRNMLEAIAGWKIVCNETGPETRSVSKTKTASITADNRTYKISVSGSFITKYVEEYHAQRFKGIESLTSKASGDGTWTQTGYEHNLVELGRTYQITVSGTFKVAGAVFRNKLVYVEFYCDAQGGVS